MIETLGTHFLGACERWAARTAVIDASGASSFADCRRAAMSMAGLISERTSAPPVGILLPACKEFLAAYYGTLLCGKAAVPLNLLVSPGQLAWVARDAGLDLVLTTRRLAPLAEATGARALYLEDAPLAGPPASWRPAPVNPDDLATLLYTSGTEADPKGVMLSHRNLLSNALASREAFGLGETDVILGPLPLFHSFGLTTCLLLPNVCGAAVAYLPRFSADHMVRMIADHKVTCVLAVPTMYRVLLASRELDRCDVSSLRLCVAGGEPVHRDVTDAFLARLSLPLLEGYGLTESAPVLTVNRPHANRPGTAGQAISGVELRVVDDEGRDRPPGAEGEIWARGENVMLGYHRHPEATAGAITRDGWLRTGDIGALDADGYLRITGRRKEIIICAGENVSPVEIENVLLQHPAVFEAAVVPVRDASRGEAPKAFVSLRPGAVCKPAELRDHCARRLPRFKVPREIEVRPDLPHGPTGKVLRRALR